LLSSNLFYVKSLWTPIVQQLHDIIILFSQ
jgi:hypothetical protein